MNKMNYETENIEFMAQFTEEIYKEIIAFANIEGGIVYVVIDNEGNAIGLKMVDDTGHPQGCSIHGENEVSVITFC